MAFPFDDGSNAGYVVIRPPALARVAPLIVAVFYLLIPLVLYVTLSRGLEVACHRFDAQVLGSEVQCTVTVHTPLKVTTTTVTAKGAVAARERVKHTGSGKHRSTHKWVELTVPNGQPTELTEHFDGGTALRLGELATGVSSFLTGGVPDFHFAQPLTVASAVWIMAGVMAPLSLLMLLLAGRANAVRLESADDSVEVWWSFGPWTKRATVVPRSQLAGVEVVYGYRGSRALVFTRKEGRPVRIASAGGSRDNAEAVRALVFGASRT